MSELDQLRQAISTLEAQRPLLGDAVVEAALAPMREKLAALTAQQGISDPQLKYITVLFTDIAGSTRLTQGMEPEDIISLMDGALKHLSGVIETHGGHVTRFMGDGFKAVFGLQVAHEDDAERAVRAGLGLIEAAKAYAIQVDEQWGRSGFNIRVGINSGPVAIGGFSEAGDTVMGLTVNLAARMESAAPVGGVLISSQTYQHVQAEFDVEPLEPIAAKGFVNPIPVYLVNRPKSRAFLTPKGGVQGVVTRMVGRNAELKGLQDLFELVLRTSQTQLVTILGDPGVGKSRLLYEFDRWVMARSEVCYYFRGRAIPQMAGTPYALLRDLFADRLGILDSDPAALARQKLEDGLFPVFAEEAQLKTHIIGALLGYDFAGSPHLLGIQNEPLQLRDRALFYLEQCITALAGQGPTLVFLEDIHWADKPSLEAILHIACHSQGLQLLIVCLARPAMFERYPDWGHERLEEPSVHARINLVPLSTRSCHQLVEEILQKMETQPDKLRDLIVAAAEGNPFYIEELIKNLIADGVIQVDEAADRWQVDPARLQDLRVPPTLTALLQARLDSLPPAEKATLQQASVVGRIFWDALLQALQTADQPPTQALSSLIQHELIYPRQGSLFAGTNEFIFKHALLRDVAYETVLKRARQAYHARVAAWLVEATQASGRFVEYAALIADHYAQAGELNPAADWFLQAGERALAQGAPAEARQFFDRSLQYLPPEDRQRRWRALLGRDEAFGILGESEARLAADQALLDLAHEMEDDRLLAEAYSHVGYYLSITGDQTGELQAYQASLAAARRVGDHRTEALVLPLMVICLSRLGETELAAAHAEQALTLAGGASDEILLARALINLSVFYGETGDVARAVQLAQQQVEICRRLGNRLGELIGLGNLGYHYLTLGLFDQGRQTIEQSIKLAKTIGARRDWAYHQLNLGLACLRLGDLEAARQTLDTCTPELETIGARFGLAAASSYFGLLHEACGDSQEALYSFSAAEQAYSEIGARGYALDALAGMARSCLRQEQLELACQDANKVWQHLDQEHGQGLEFPALAYQTCAEVFAAAGEPEKADLALSSGYDYLTACAAKISDLNWRASYLENIPEHRALIEAWNRIP